MEVKMDFGASTTLHRQRPGSPLELITEDSFAEIVTEFMQTPEAQRNQYSAVIGGLVYDHRELQNLVRYLGEHLVSPPAGAFEREGWDAAVGSRRVSRDALPWLGGALVTQSIGV
jgi:hypothetical protein